MEFILKKPNEIIARWLDERSRERGGQVAAIQKRTGQLSILPYFLPIEDRRANNAAFQSKIQDARRAQLPPPESSSDHDNSSISSSSGGDPSD